jgi:hypothetical protein
MRTPLPLYVSSVNRKYSAVVPNRMFGARPPERGQARVVPS